MFLYHLKHLLWVSFPTMEYYMLFTHSRLLELLEFKNWRYVLMGNTFWQHFKTGLCSDKRNSDATTNSSARQLSTVWYNSPALDQREILQASCFSSLSQTTLFSRWQVSTCPVHCHLLHEAALHLHTKVTASWPIPLHNWKHTSTPILNSAYHDLSACPIRLWMTSGQMVSHSPWFPSI